MAEDIMRGIDAYGVLGKQEAGHFKPVKAHLNCVLMFRTGSKNK